MPRQPRFAIPAQPQHVIQRGNNRTAMFVAVDDYLFFQECLRFATLRFKCEVHAYVLMTNHVHLLISPDDHRGIAQVMQSVGRRYVQHFNQRQARTGTLFEGRYRATIIDTDEYLFTCYRYIELNPVRAGLVQLSAEYRWSSHAANALGKPDPLVTPHESYMRLGATPTSRQAAYRGLFGDAIEERALIAIRNATNKGWALGSERFRAEVSRIGRRAGPLPTGRHRRNEAQQN